MFKFIKSLFTTQKQVVTLTYNQQLANALIICSPESSAILYEQELKSQFLEVPSLISEWKHHCSVSASVNPDFNVDINDALKFVATYLFKITASLKYKN
jgi:hypothetical protein